MKYTHLVIAIPHSSGDPHTAIGASWGDDPEVTRERDRWTDWFTDELFDSEGGGIDVVKCDGSRFDCDVERLEREPDRICRHSMIDGETDTATFRNAMLSDWYQYRAELLDKASRGGENPLIAADALFEAIMANARLQTMRSNVRQQNVSPSDACRRQGKERHLHVRNRRAPARRFLLCLLSSFATYRHTTLLPHLHAWPF